MASLIGAWSTTKPYSRSQERLRATGFVCAVVLLKLVLVGTTILFTLWQGVFYKAFKLRDWRGFLGSLLWSTDNPKDGFAVGLAPTLVIFVLATAYELYLRELHPRASDPAGLAFPGSGDLRVRRNC